MKHHINVGETWKSFSRIKVGPQIQSSIEKRLYESWCWNIAWFGCVAVSSLEISNLQILLYILGDVKHVAIDVDYQ